MSSRIRNKTSLKPIDGVPMGKLMSALEKSRRPGARTIIDMPSYLATVGDAGIREARLDAEFADKVTFRSRR